MASRNRMTAGDRRAIGAGALALLLGVVIGAAPSGCGFHTSGLETTTGSGGMTGASSSSSSSSGAMCTTASECKGGDDCVTWSCTNHACASVPKTAGTTCAAGVCDNMGTCVGCFVQGAVTLGCKTGEYCFDEACASCTDTTKGGDETDVDCGGIHCGKCADLKMCQKAADCVSGLCNTGASPPVCISCTDGVKDGNETDKDCGGSTCTTKCGLGQGCLASTDCAMMECPAGKCTACHDGVKNGDETDIDCGGSCPACNGSTCTTGPGCKSGNCVLGICCDTACVNGTSGTTCESCALPGAMGTCTMLPAGESSTCTPGKVCDGQGVCQGLMGMKGPVGQACSDNGHCYNGDCKAGFCRLTTGDYCSTSVECDTDFCSNHVCAACTGAGDCAGNPCMGGTCKLPDTAVCKDDTDCAVGKCTAGACGLPNGPPMMTCAKDADCHSGRCHMSQCAPCGSDAECGTNGKCLVPGPNGVCLNGPKAYCQVDSDCLNGTCVPSPIFGQCN